MLAAAGAKITDMPLTEVRAAMQAGKLDVAQNSFELFVSMRFHEFAKSVTVGGHSTLTVFMPVLISKAVWEELSDTERQALEEAAAASDIYFEASAARSPRRRRSTSSRRPACRCRRSRSRTMRTGCRSPRMAPGRGTGPSARGRRTCSTPCCAASSRASAERRKRWTPLGRGAPATLARGWRPG